MSELVVGTAGHIDHGKTALVTALTGVQCDRLDEERRRGMSIELGFAAWTLPSGREVSIVDVPGHERFIRTMAVGARSTDLALLCVAADDGIMPQTTEHAAVLRVLRVRRALVVVTKVALAPERAELVGAGALELLRELGIAARSWVATSAQEGVGLDQLAAAVDLELDAIEDPPDRNCPRLLVDRSFSRVGIGTVVTGVLDGGRLHQGDAIEVFPGGKHGQVQALQRRNRSVRSAEPGGRLALALRGVAVKDVPRGSVVGHVGTPRPSSRFDCLLQIPPRGASGLRQGMTVEVLCGAATVEAQLWLAGETRLLPASTGYGQLKTRAPLWILPGDHFVLRAPHPAAVVGGGMVLDPSPGPHHRWWNSHLDYWVAREQALESGLRKGLPLLAVIEASTAPRGLTLVEAARRAGATPTSASSAIETAHAEGRLTRVGSLYLSPPAWDQVVLAARAEIVAHERSHPLDPGISRRELLLRLGFETGPDGDAVILRLQGAGELAVKGPLVGMPGSSFQGRRSTAVERTAALLRRAGTRAPGAMELRQAGSSKRVVGYLVRSGEAVQLEPDVLIAKAALEGLEAKLMAELAKAPAGLTVAALRDRLTTTRRVLIPMLERLARSRVTERVDDLHRLRRQPRGDVECG